MNVTARHDQNHAFVLRPDDARRLWETLEKRVGAVQAKARCADSIQRTFSSIDELLKYDNSRARSIRRLSFTARSKNMDASAEVELGGYLDSLEASAQGDEEKVIALRNAFGDFFDGIRPWFSPIAKVDFFYILFGVFMLLMLVAQLMAGDAKRPMDFATAVKSTVFVVAFLGSLVLLIWGLNRLRSRFFPMGTFALGQGESRFSVDENVRWVVLVGFLVSTVSSLVVAFLWQ